MRKKPNGISLAQSGFLTLVAMQLRENISISFKAHRKDTLLKLALYVIGIGAVTGFISLLLYLLNRLGVFGIAGYLPVPMWNIVLYAMIILNFFACINKVTDALYFSSDNQILLCFPVEPNKVFFSKITVFCITELIRNCFSLLPLLLSFGIIYGLPWYFYPWMIFILLLFAILPVAIASVLSIPYLYIKAFLKRYSWVSSALMLAALLAAAILVFYLIYQLPANLDITRKWSSEYFPAINNAARSIETVLFPLSFLSTLAIGYTTKGTENPNLLKVFTRYSGWVLAVVLGIIVVCVLLSNFLARPLYFKMASKSFEFEKPQIRHTYMAKAEVLDEAPEIIIRPKKQVKTRVLRRILRDFALKHVPTDDRTKLTRALNRFQKIVKFELVEEKVTIQHNHCYILTKEEGIERLSLLIFANKKDALLYCPHHARRKNVKVPSFFSFLFKEIKLAFRSYQSIASVFLLFITCPLATLVLNAIFNAMKKSFDGQVYTILFNALIIACITLSTNVSMASIYSREGKANYQLRSSPSNYMQVLGSKLMLRAAVMTASIASSIAIYNHFCSLSYVRMDLLFVAFYALYLGHLLWSAELDYMNPQIGLYAETGGQLTINPNEAVSSALTFILSFAFAGITYFFVDQSVTDGFTRVMIAALIFLAARIVLFYMKIRGYGTSTYEGRGGK